MMKVTKWKVWNVDKGTDVPGKALRSLVRAVSIAEALEVRSGEHHAVVPA